MYIPTYLHQLGAVKKLLDKTGLELPKLLTFWSDISTSGDKSLYKRLFLTHNLVSLDKTFKDAVDTPSAKISDHKHKPVIMAAFNLSSDDIEAIMSYRIAFLVKQNILTDTEEKKLTDATIEATIKMMLRNHLHLPKKRFCN